MVYILRKSFVIVCDLGGVLFQYRTHEVSALLQGKMGNSPFAPVDEMVSLIQRCHDCVDVHGKHIHRLYILSNFSQKAFEVLGHFHKPIMDLFDGVVLSSQVGYSKPDRRIYEYLLHTYKLSAAECFFIDDEKLKVQAACAVGMRGIVYRGATDVERELKQAGVI